MRKESARGVFVILAALAVGSAVAQEYLPEDPRAEELRRRYLLAGRVYPLTSYPLSRSEFLAASALLPATGSATEAKSASDPASASEPILRAGIETALALGLRSSDLTIEDLSGATNGIDLRRRWLDEPPLVRFGGSLENGSGLEVAVEGQLKREWASTWDSWNNLPGNGPSTNPFPVDNHFYTRGILAWDSPAFMATFGRDKIHLGPGQGSSLLASENLPYLDSFRFRAPMGRWSFDWVVATIDNGKAAQDVDTDYWGLDGPVDGTISDFLDGGGYGFEGDANPSIIFYNVHRAQWTGERLRLAIAGQMVIVRANNAFQLVDFFPIATWHNADVIPNNMCMVLDGSWAVLPGLAINFSAGFDDFSAATFGLGDSGVPTIDAYLLSVEYALDAGGFAFDAYLEGGYTHYLWGNFDGSVTMGQDRCFLAKMIARYKTDSGEVLLPLTSPYGPGALWTELRIDAKPKGSPFGLGVDLLLLSKNTKADLVTTEFTSDDTIATAPRRLSLDAGVTATLALGGGRIRARPSVLFSGDEIAAALDLSVGWSFGSLRALPATY
jgi:hypothetical protein